MAKNTRGESRYLMLQWCAYPTETPGVWSLGWNETNKESNGNFVMLRNYDNPLGMKSGIGAGPCRSDKGFLS